MLGVRVWRRNVRSPDGSLPVFQGPFQGTEQINNFPCMVNCLKGAEQRRWALFPVPRAPGWGAGGWALLTKYQAQGRAACKWQSWDLNLHLPHTRLPFLREVPPDYARSPLTSDPSCQVTSPRTTRTHTPTRFRPSSAPPTPDTSGPLPSPHATSVAPACSRAARFHSCSGE